MIERQLRILALLGVALAVTACGGSNSDDDDASGAGKAALNGGSGGGGATGGGAGSPPLGGSAGVPGTAGGGGNAGNPGGAGGGGTAGSAGMPTAGGAGQAGSSVTPLSPTDDPSRISELSDCALAQAGTCVVPIARTKDEVCQHFASDWPKQAPTDYMLPADDCAAASVGAGAEADALRRLNFYRWLSALPPAAVNEEWSTHAAACSIIQAHLDEINHYPPADSTCYTDLGGAASSESLLDIGGHTPADAMDDLIWDWGQRNFHVLGHRWWLLHPGLSEIGLGFSYPSDANRATCVRDTAGDYIDRAADLTGVVTYPSYGVTPYELISREAYARPVDYPLEWSLTLQDDIDVSTATMRVYREGKSAYELVQSTSGPTMEFNGMWLNLAEEPVPPGTYLVLVSGTGRGDFGYRAKIERCGADAPLTCDVVAQDCGVAGDGCYNPDAPFCTKSGSLEPGTACKGNLPAECVAGSVCVEDMTVHDAFECAPYCDPKNDDPTTGCTDVCPGNYIIIDDHQTSAIVGGYCEPGTGDSCDPLSPHCPTGQACYSWEPSKCFTAGAVAKAQPCKYTNDCEPGLVCIGTDTAADKCEPYCDLAATTGDDACITLCPDAYFEYDTFGVCKP